MHVGAAILGTASLLPGRPVATGPLLAEAMPDRDPARVQRKIGIDTRFWVAPGDSVAWIGASVTTAALHAAGVPAHALARLILVNSSGGDHPIPATANGVAAELGLDNATGCFDLNNACTGFVSAVDLGFRLAATGAGPVAVVAVEVLSRWVSPAAPRAYVVLADAAGAAIIGPSTSGALLGASFGNDGRGDRIRAVHLQHGADSAIDFDVPAREVVEYALPDLRRSAEEACGRADVPLAAVDWFVVHQPTGPMFDAFLDVLGARPEQTVRVVDRIGSVGAASVAVGLDELWRSKPVRPGDTVLLAAVGGGTSRGAVLLRTPA